MNTLRINPGIYPVFRIFLVIRIIFSIYTIITQNYIVPQRLPRIPMGSTYSGMVMALLVLVLISVPWLIQKMGKFHLPAALLASTLGPQLDFFVSAREFIVFLGRMETTSSRFIIEMSRQIVISEQLQLIVLLSVPIIIISWHYSYRVVFPYVILLSVLDIITISMISMISLEVDSTRVITILLIKPLLFFLIGYIINRLVNEQKQQNIRLENANRQLASYASTLEQLAVSRERNRLAREFHDTLAHTLSAVAVQLEAVGALWSTQPSDAHRILKDSLNNTRQGLTETRRAIQSLRASALEDMGFKIALHNLATTYAERYHFKIQVDLPENPNLDPRLEHNLYRITEEALRNIGRHSNAKNVDIRFIQNPKPTLIIHDDGLGFSPEAEKGTEKFGLWGMKEYAEDAGFSLNIISKPDFGTTINVTSGGTA